MTRIAVIDVETTGLFPGGQDRVVELAALVMRLDGTVTHEFETLVNPRRDIGPTQIHGLVTADVIHAPVFGEIIGDLIAAIDGCVAIAGHNVRFDLSFLQSEFDRYKIDFPDVPSICTMKLCGGGSLSHSCKVHQIEFEGKAHSAINDAKASAKLLSVFLNDSDLSDSDLLSIPPIKWPKVPQLATKLVTRSAAQQNSAARPGYIQSLVSRAGPSPGQLNSDDSLLEYRGLLDHVLEDRVIEQSEGRALVRLAESWGLSGEQVMYVHEEYLSQLADAAWADGVVTDAESRDLVQVSDLLGIEKGKREEIFNRAETSLKEPKSQSHRAVDEFLGKSVCFTGACQCVVGGERVTRAMSRTLAEKHGMITAKSVTKKLDFLIVADPYTQSGKARKAREYGTRILQARVFWRALGLEVT